MKRVFICFLAWAVLLLLPLVGAGGAQAQAQVADDSVPGHAIDTNESGDVVVAAVKESGRLFTRTRSNDVWSSWQAHGLDTWLSADISIDDDGNVALIGLKDSGALWTRDQDPAAGWGVWTRQGQPTWSTETVPSISTDAGTTTLAAIKEDGSLFTRTRAAEEEWSSWLRHGARNWAHADIAVFEDVSLLAGTKAAGELYTRVVTPERGEWVLQGETFSVETAPSISLHDTVLALGAINANSALVRTGVLDRTADVPVQAWDTFDPPVSTSVASIAVAAASDHISFAYVGTSGELTKSGLQGAPGAWEPVSRSVYLGFAGWSTSVSPSIAAAPRTGTSDATLAVGADGGVTVLIEGADESRLFSRLGRPTWAAGVETVTEPVETPTEFEPGLYVVGDDALPAGRYQIDSPGACAWVRFSSLSADGLLDNDIGSSLDPTSTQNVIDILPGDAGFQLIDLGGAGCGNLSLYEAPASLASSIVEGTYVVGDDIEPGRYVSDTACDWSRLQDFSGAADSEISYDAAIFGGRQIVDVLPSDVGLKISGLCEFSFRVAPATPATQVDPGMYVVRSDVAAGRYVVSAGCSFARLGSFLGRSPVTDAYLDLLGGFPANVSPADGGNWIVDLAPTDIGFLLGSIDGRSCQAETYVEADAPADRPTPGTNVVGVDFEPGFYLAPGGTGCFWQRLSGFGWSGSDIIAGSGNQDTEVLVEILETDVGFHASSLCGAWTPFDAGGIAGLEAAGDASTYATGKDAFQSMVDRFRLIELASS